MTLRYQIGKHCILELVLEQLIFYSAIVYGRSKDQTRGTVYSGQDIA